MSKSVFIPLTLLCGLTLTSGLAAQEGTLADSEHARPDTVVNPDLVNAQSWREQSEYLIEPLARYIDSASLTLVNETSKKIQIPRIGQTTVVDLSSPERRASAAEEILQTSVLQREKSQGFLGLYRATFSPSFSTNNQGVLRIGAEERDFEFISGSKRIEVSSTQKQAGQEVGEEGEHENTSEESSGTLKSLTRRFARFISPSSVRGLSYLQKTSLEDSVYNESNQTYSPVSLSCLASEIENKGDDILRLPVSFNDIHPFTQAKDTASYTYVDKKTLYVPRTRASKSAWPAFSTLAGSQVCASKTFAEGSRVGLEKPRTSRSTILNVGVTSEKSYYVAKEEVYIIKSVPKSPLSESAYEYYFIGSETYLPYYKIEYDHAGKERRLLVANWVYLPGASTSLPVLAALDSYDLTSEALVSISLIAYTDEVASDCLEEFYETVCPTKK